MPHRPDDLSRRDFLRRAAASAASFAVGGILPGVRAAEPTLAPAAPATKTGEMPRRPYGKSKTELSVIGFGGILVMGAEQDHANRLVAEAVDRGVNYFDVAPSYGDAEIKLGPALRPYRQKVFLACKTTERQRDKATAEFEQSLKRLETDHFDLYQVHGIVDVAKDVDVAFARGGVMELLTQARKDGRVRHLGFSAHSAAAALAAMNRFEFDSVLFPVSFTTWFKGGFGPQIMRAAQDKGVTRLALKAMARQRWPKDAPERPQYAKCWYQPLTDPREAELGLRFTLSQPVTALLPPGEEALFRAALDLVPKLKPITPAETEELQALAATLDPIFQQPA